MKQVNKKLKKQTLFRPLILSRHPSHNVLRARNKLLPLMPFKSVIRFGSTTEVEDTIANGGKRVEINSIESIKNSANKLLMKKKFTEAGVKTAEWIEFSSLDDLKKWAEERYPIVAKNHYGSKGKGNTLINSKEELDEWLVGKTLKNYIFEKFVRYALEFRYHITEKGCFYVCRKALKQGVDEKDKWRRHDDICVWLLETNPDFKKPNTHSEIIEHCVKALKAIGADVLSFDVKVQSPLNNKGEIREYQDFILLECNSASSMNNNKDEISICAQKYIEEIPKIIINKIKN